MRRIKRLPLPLSAREYLRKKQTELLETPERDAAKAWDTARQTRALARVDETLRRMAGIRERCMFCEDSRGVDIEHYRPKALPAYREWVFVWENLLLACAGCNRRKGVRFPVDARGNPLLIDPTAENPWDSLYYDSRTGRITGSFDPVTGEENPRGKATANPELLPLNIEAITEGRLATARNLSRAVRNFLDRAADRKKRSPVALELLESVRDNRDYGLAEWFFLEGGKDQPPFSHLSLEYPEMCERIARLLQ